jgi:hypothetical protein
MKGKVLFLGCFLAASSSLVSAATVLQVSPSGYNSIRSPLLAYPALSAVDKACAETIGATSVGQGIPPTTLGSLGWVHTPLSLGIACGLPANKLADMGYLSSMFVVFVDMHRYAIGHYCPSPYEISQGALMGSLCPW